MARGRDMILRIRTDDTGSPVVSDFADTVEDETKRINKANARMSKHIDREFRRARLAFAAMGTAVVGVAGAAIKSAIDFESSFASVRKTVDATEEEFADLSQGIRDMAKEVPLGVDQLNQMASVAGQLGVEKENILDYTRVVAEMGVASDLAGEQAAFALARISEAAGVPQENVRNLASAIVDLGNNAAATESEIVDVALGLSSVGKQAGISIQTILGISASIKEMGLESQASATAVQRVVTGMIGAVQSGGEELEGFARIAGTSVAEFEQLFREDANAALMTFLEGVGRMGQTAVPALDEVGLGSQRTLRAILALGGGFDTVREQVDRANRGFAESTALSDEASRRFDTMASKIQIIRNRIRDAGIEMGFNIVQNERLNEAIVRLGRQLEETGIDLTAFAGALGTVAAELFTVLVESIDKANRKIMDFMAMFGVESPQAFLQVLRGLVGAFNKLPGGANPATAAMETMLEAIREGRIETEEAEEELRGYVKPFRLVLAEARMLNPELRNVADNQDGVATSTGNAARTLRDQVDAWRENLDMLNRYREFALKQTKTEVDDFTDRMGVFTEFVFDATDAAKSLGGPDGALDFVVGSMEDAQRSFERFEKSGFERVFDGIKESVLSIGEGMGFIGKEGGFDLFGGLKNLGSGVIEGLGQALSGGITSAISAGINALISAITKLFGSDAADFTEKLNREFSALGPISGDLADRFGELANDLKDTGEGIAFVRAKAQLMGDILRDTGIDSADAFAFAAEEVKGFFDLVEQGAITMDDLRKGVEGALPVLIENLDQMDEAGRRSFRSLIEHARESGEQFEELDRLVRNAAQGIAGGVQQMLEAGIQGRGQAQFAADALVTAFNELIAQGVPATQAMEMLRGQFDELHAQTKELGVVMPEAFLRLQHVFDVLADEKIAKVQQRIDGMGQTMRSLLELGIKPSAQQFNVFENNVVKAFEQLRAQGLTAQQSFMAMGDDFKLLARLQNEFGMEVDEATRKLFEEAGATDLLEEEGISTQDVLREGFEGLFDRFDALLSEFGVVVDDTFSGAADDVKTHLADIELTGKDHFTALGEHAGFAAQEALEEWQQVHQQMVGNSILPDIQAQASVEFQKIGESAKDAAMVTTRGFEDTAGPFRSLPGRLPSGGGGGGGNRARFRAELGLKEGFDDTELGRLLARLLQDELLELELIRPGD